MQEWYRTDPFLIGHDLSDSDLHRILSLRLKGCKSFEGPLFDIAGQSVEKAQKYLYDSIRHHARILHKKKGSVLVRGGAYSDSAFFVIKGQVRHSLPKHTPRSRNFLGLVSRLFRYKKFDWNTRFRQDKNSDILVGEGHIVALIETLDRIPHTADIRAETDIEVLELRWPLLRIIRDENKRFSLYADHAFHRHILALYLRSLPIFAELEEEAINLIADNAVLKNFGRSDWYVKQGKEREQLSPSEQGKAETETEAETEAETETSSVDLEETIIEQGGKADNLVILWSGFTRVVHKAHHGFQILRLQRRNEIHGMQIIAQNWVNKSNNMPQARWAVSTQTVGYAKILLIPSSYIEYLVLPTLPARVVKNILNDKRSTRFLDMGGGDENHKIFNSESVFLSSVLGLMEKNRFLNGTQGMLINLDRCVRCFECVTACANLHGGTAVFSWHGIRQSNYMISNACMHCVDPVCMSECPTGAISRSGKQKEVLINEETCIGCGACSEACPYDNISMVNAVHNDKAEQKPQAYGLTTKAVKCDLCSGKAAKPACQSACPHDALLRVDMTNIKSITKWIRR